MSDISGNSAARRLRPSRRSKALGRSQPQELSKPKTLPLFLPLLFALGCGPTDDRPATKSASEQDSSRNRTRNENSPKQKKRVASAPANGWGEHIAWRSLEEGRREAAESNMPLMLVVWTPWCSKCRALKKHFSTNTDVQSLSEQFVMVNVDQDAVPQAETFAPDGTYIPRIVFFDNSGEVDPALRNGARQRFRYFYSPDDDIAAKMRQALKRHSHAP